MSLEGLFNLKTGNEFLLVHQSDTVKEVWDSINARPNKYIHIVIEMSGGKHAYIYAPDLIAFLKSEEDGAPLTTATLDKKLEDFPDLLSSRVAPVHSITITEAEAWALAKQAPHNCVIIKDESGSIAGVWGDYVRSGGIDADWMNSPVASKSGGFGVLGIEDSAGEAASASEDGEEKTRKVDITLWDDDREIDAKTEGLDVGTDYSLEFAIKYDSSNFALVKGKEAEFNEAAFAEGEQEILLDIKLTSDDFEIKSRRGRPLTERNMPYLTVPRTGESDIAEVRITPKKNGPAKITVQLLKEGALVQVIELNFHIGPLFNARVLGPGIEAAFMMQKRDVGLTIIDMGHSFQLILTGAVAATATIPININTLHVYIAEMRKELQDKVVHMKYGAAGDPIYQMKTKIPEDAKDAALSIMAKAGFNLYRKIFFGPAADAQTKLLGQRLRDFARDEEMTIQIFSQHFMLPWALLYMSDTFPKDKVDPKLFLGLKHVIEHIPLQTEMKVLSRKINAKGGLRVGLTVNEDIDKEMRYPMIKQQLEYWEELKKESSNIQVTVRKTATDLLTDIQNTEVEDQILYFYCHAVSRELDEKGGPSNSMLKLSGHQKITLDDLHNNTYEDYPGAPLVFINACESAELSPLFYDGFVPYFMSKGARGVIGTECETPALFAVEFSKLFFRQFLEGKPLGQIFLDLRKEYFYEKNNIMGLLYSLYVDGDTRIENAPLAAAG